MCVDRGVIHTPELPADAWEQGFALAPWGIDLLLTDACNLRCSYCPIWGDDAVVPSPAHMMDTEAALRFLDDVARFHPMIRLFGGEPFLHPHWLRIVEHARGLGLVVTAVSNGMRIEREADALVRSGLLAIGVSLDTDSRVNDAARGAGSLATVRRGLDLLAAAKAHHGVETPAVEIYTTVHEGTYRQLVGWADELRSWQIGKLRLQHLIWFSGAQLAASMALLGEQLPDPRFFRSEDASFRRDVVPDMDLEVLAAELATLRSQHYPFVLECHPDLPVDEMVRYYSEREFERAGQPRCTTMESYAFVDPRGRLYPCMTLDMGNVFATSFDDVWNGESFRAFRRVVRREHRLPLCHRCPDGCS